MATFNRKAQGEIPMIILLVLMSMIIMYVIFISPAEREKLIGSTAIERYALDTQPGLVKGTPTTLQRTDHNLGLVNIDYSPIKSTSQLSNQIVIRRSLISDQPAVFSTNINTDDLADATLKFNVVDKLGEKELYVLVNDAIVFTGILGIGEQSISLPDEKLADGTNTFEIHAASPGWRFWEKTVYSLSSVGLETETYLPTQASAQQIFTLATSEVTGISSAKLTAYAKQASATPKQLSINLNGKTIYSATPSLFTSLSIDLPPSILLPTNTLEWAVEKGGKYEIQFPKVAVAYTKTPTQIKSWTFEVADSELYAGNCWLIINSPSMARTDIDVHVNSQILPLEMKDGELKEDICKYLQGGENYLIVYSDEDVTIDRLSVLMQTKF